MDKIKEAWQEFPKGWVSILAVAAFFIGLGWAVSEVLAACLPEHGLVNNSIWIKVLITSAFAGLAYFIFDVFYYFYRIGAVVRLDKDAGNCFLAEISKPACCDVKIFASGGEDAKNQFLKLTQEDFKPKKTVKVSILLRSDGNAQRDQALKSLVDRWRKDIDEVTQKNKGGFEFQTKFVTYPHPVMLKGYLFGHDVAILSWYARDGSAKGLRTSPNLPFTIIKKGAAGGASILQQANNTFDFYFESGGVL